MPKTLCEGSNFFWRIVTRVVLFCAKLPSEGACVQKMESLSDVHSEHSVIKKVSKACGFAGRGVGAARVQNGARFTRGGEGGRGALWARK